MMKHVNDPRYRGVIVRQINPQIKGPGGVFEKSKDISRQIFGDNPKLNIRERDLEIVFPSGGNILFRHCQRAEDKYNFQGWEISSLLIDEAQQLGYDEVVYLMSRLRTDADMKPYMRMTCNPDKNSWLRQWVDWYLIPGTGLPDPDKCGVLRYYVMQENTPVWADSKAELYEKFGADASPLSFTFISANVYDNPVLMERQPEYVAWLEGLPRVDRARLLLGDWDAVESSAGYWKRDWIEIVDHISSKRIKTVRAYDLAATIPSETNTNPDWTCGVKTSKLLDGKYIIEDVIRFRDRFLGVEQRIFEQAELDGRGTTIILPIDPGAASKAYVQDLSRRLAERGFTVRLKPTTSSKIVRFGPFATVSEAGSILVLRANWNEDWFSELEAFTGDGKTKDDQVDATADSFWGCKTGLEIPSFKLPDMQTTNPFAFARA